MNWLKKYYGADFDKFSPSIVHEGKKWAVVKITRAASMGFSGVGYVLIRRNGNHAASPYLSLHEGPATKEDLAEMQAALHRKEQES